MAQIDDEAEARRRGSLEARATIESRNHVTPAGIRQQLEVRGTVGRRHACDGTDANPNTSSSRSAYFSAPYRLKPPIAAAAIARRLHQNP